MKTFNEFLAKLDKLNFVEQLASEHYLISDEGFKISYNVELHNQGFQVVIRIAYNGQYVMSWGCENIQQQNDFGKWFLEKKHIIIENEYNKMEKTKAIGKSILENL